MVNGLIGAGIFGLPSGAAALAGEYSVLVYGFCALLMGSGLSLKLKAYGLL